MVHPIKVREGQLCPNSKKRNESLIHSHVSNQAHACLRPNAQLCEKCQAVFSQWTYLVSESRQTFIHYESSLALQTSAEEDYDLCSQFLRDFEEIEP